MLKKNALEKTSMNITLAETLSQKVEIQVHGQASLARRLPQLEAYFSRENHLRPLSQHPAWLAVLARGLNHTPYCLEAVESKQTRGYLVLSYVNSFLFGRFLVSLPFLNYGGVQASDETAANRLIDAAVALADDLKVRYLELRHETSFPHAALTHTRQDKVHMRLDLPAAAQTLWEALPAKVRNQVRKAQKSGLTVAWGNQELLPEFYAVFSRNMRDLGTPAYGKLLFAHILFQFQNRAEICVV